MSCIAFWSGDGGAGTVPGRRCGTWVPLQVAARCLWQWGVDGDCFYVSKRESVWCPEICFAIWGLCWRNFFLFCPFRSLVQSLGLRLPAREVYRSCAIGTGNSIACTCHKHIQEIWRNCRNMKRHAETCIKTCRYSDGYMLSESKIK